jgi:hypothetical protein
MEKRPQRRTVNQIQKIEESETLDLITPDTNVTQMPYQGFVSNQEYYSRMQASCFDLDSAINEIVSKKFTGNNLRNMTDEDAINAYKALEQAKLNRSKVFMDLASHMSNDEFFRKQQEIERLRVYGKNKIIDGEVIQGEIVSNEVEETPKISGVERETQQHVIRLLQEAVMKKLEEQE